MTRGTLGMQPNPLFAAVVTQRFAPDAPIVVGCQSGMRSQKACQILEAAGFTNLVNMECGFGGGPDAAGNPRPGWSACGLPTAAGRPAGRSYADLSAAR
jgi:hypothetical protein